MSEEKPDDVQIDLDAEVPESAPEPARPRRARRPRRTRGQRLLIAGCVLVALAGVAFAGGTLYVDSIPTPQLQSLPSGTTVLYRDGSVLARLGSIDATVLNAGQLLTELQQVAVAAEDPDFWTDGTGPITRSVVRRATATEPTTMAGKVRLVAQAWKLDHTYSKDDILAYYLNATPFGRQTYGVEAAARVYFGKTARADAPAERRLTLAEAMLLLTLVRQPYPDVDNPEASPGFDPAASARAEENSRRRWAEIRDSMVARQFLTADAAAGHSYPAPLPPVSGPNARSAGLTAPAALVVNHVLDELTHTTGSPFENMPWHQIEDGGFTITTTIDPGLQQELERAADETVAGSAMNGQPQNLQAAGVVVQPGTGRVLAYFGGHDGLGSDYAGFYFDEKREATGVGRYPPGGSFLPYTLAAALKSGYSLQSRWQWTTHVQLGRPSSNPIRNDSTCGSDVTGTGMCSLLESVASTLYVPMYDVTVGVGPAKVLEAARDAGIDSMWNDSRERQNLRTADLARLTPSQFDIVLGIGQYSVTVLDQANAMATFAAGGLRATAHFVQTVRQGEEIMYAEILPNPDQPRMLTPTQAADLTYALTWTGPSSPNATVATKTGWWEFDKDPSRPAHAWSLGYTPELAVAIHIGNRAEDRPLTDRNGASVFGGGLPNTILRRVINGVPIS
jgi:membrane peptidoglycan carboxypeptidase